MSNSEVFKLEIDGSQWRKIVLKKAKKIKINNNKLSVENSREKV